jgi:hypothetical protein
MQIGTVALGVAAAVAVGVGYLVGKEEGREEAKEEASTATSSSSSSSSAHPSLVPAHPAYDVNERKEGEPAAPSSSSPDETHLCSICLDAPTCMVLVDCGHQCACRDCVKPLRECPICRMRIKRKPIQVYKA